MAHILGRITTDTIDAEARGGWWAEQTGAQVGEIFRGTVVIVVGGGLPVLLAFQKVDDPTPGKNRVHLDLTVDDLDGEVERLLDFCVAGRNDAAAELQADDHM